MFERFKKQNVEAMNTTPKSHDPNTDPGWRETTGSDVDVAMAIYKSLLKLDSSEKLGLRINSIPGFQFTITKERI